MALAFFVGSLPFISFAYAHAKDTSSDGTYQASEGNPWLDDYSKPVGFTYGANATIQTAYLWRGLYAGGANLQASAEVGYGGLFVNMWWNIGVTDWSFRVFQPEVDLSLGFARWGLKIYALYIYNFNCPFFDFQNYVDKGNRLELNASYTVSSKIPLSIHWATRLAAADGYLNESGDVVRAWSSYAAISYTQQLPYDISLYGAFGITPWRSCYTGYKGDFAVQLVELRVRKDWDVSPQCGMMVLGQLCINPSAFAADVTTAAWHPTNPGAQSVNVNLGFGVYLK